MKRNWAAHKKKGGYHFAAAWFPVVRVTVERPGPDGEVVAITGMEIGPQRRLLRTVSYKQR